jgi:large subunit ribosomal protein L21
VTFDQVLMVGDGDNVTVGAPLVAGALVAGTFIATEKERTVIILKKHRRLHFDRRNGHRQRLSTVRITEILTGGAKVTTKPDEIAQKRAAARMEAAAAALVSKSAAQQKPAGTPAAKKPATKKADAAAKPAAKKNTKADASADAPAAEAAPAKAPAKAKAAKPAAYFTDDLKLIGGVGPALEKKLIDAGVTSLTQIASWKKADIAEFDEKLDFKGRIEREEWVAQAKDLVAGKPPRAKADQDALADDKAAAKQSKPAAAKKAAPKADKE